MIPGIVPEIRWPVFAFIGVAFLYVLYRELRVRRLAIERHSHVTLRPPRRERIRLAEREGGLEADDFLNALDGVRDPTLVGEDTGTELLSTEALNERRLAELRRACEYCSKDHPGTCPPMLAAMEANRRPRWRPAADLYQPLHSAARPVWRPQEIRPEEPASTGQLPAVRIIEPTDVRSPARSVEELVRRAQDELDRDYQLIMRRFGGVLEQP